MRKTILATIALMAATFLLPSPSLASLKITTGDTPPTGGLLLGYDGVPAGSFELRHGGASETAIGQSFSLASPATLDRITILFTPESDVAGELAKLWFGPFSGPDDPDMNELLLLEQGSLPSDLQIGEAVYLTIDHTDLTLEAGQHYGFLLFFSGGGNVNQSRAQVHHLGDDAYPAGRSLQWSPSGTTALDTDLVFFLQGSGATEGPGLLLHDGRFRVEARWRSAQGDEGFGTPQALTRESGYFWFFRPENVELLVKVLDACTDPYWHYWVFAAGMTNLEVTLTVTDTFTLDQRVYTHPQGEAFESLIDLAAFDGCSG